MDAHWRSITKAVTYRLSSSCVTCAVAYGVTGELKTAVAIGTFDVAAKIAWYYVHERAWNRIQHGQRGSPDYQI